MNEQQMTILKPFSRFLKRVFDVFFALFFLIVLSPLFLLLIFYVKKDQGPAFYGHERVGQHGKKFKCLKFRSMAINSQELLEHILETDPNAKQEWEANFKLKNDPRVTKIGHFIRKTSLDEIPQLINILKGEMSTVGPRPVTKKELEMYSDKVKFYLMTKPGLTGLWQVSGRNDIDYESRVELDTSYIQNWTFFKDILIILKTVKVVLNKDGAY